MPVSLWLFLALGAAQQPVPGYGWTCSVEGEVVPGTSVEISQTVEPTGEANGLSVALKHLHDSVAAPNQRLEWSMLDADEGLAGPRLLSVEVSLSIDVRKGVVRIDLPGESKVDGTAYISKRTGGRVFVTITNQAMLARLWASPTWSISVYDRIGNRRGSAGNALPGQDAVERAFRTLLPHLAAKAAAPADQCSEISDDAFI